jgi:ABC-2 type transport system ATP-binding protein
MIEIDALTKRYGRILAVDDLTVTVRSGAVTGFLGPNGAGKSTTLRLALGLSRPTAGSVRFAGHAYQDLRYPLRTVGALLDANAVEGVRSPREHLRWIARSQRLPVGRVDEVLDRVGLGSVAAAPIAAFSLGMRQRLGIATALLGDPGVLLLDEPMNGLDPAGIHWIRELLTALAAEGRTILLSSHLIGEIAQTADRLVVIGRGRLLADTTVDALAAAGAAATGEATTAAAAVETAYLRLTAAHTPFVGTTDPHTRTAFAR